MMLLMAECTMKKQIGVLSEVLVKLAYFIFPNDFMILDCKVDFEVVIILERSFLATSRALDYMDMGKMKFRLNDKQVNF